MRLGSCLLKHQFVSREGKLSVFPTYFSIISNPSHDFPLQYVLWHAVLHLGLVLLSIFFSHQVESEFLESRNLSDLSYMSHLHPETMSDTQVFPTSLFSDRWPSYSVSPFEQYRNGYIPDKLQRVIKITCMLLNTE